MFSENHFSAICLLTIIAVGLPQSGALVEWFNLLNVFLVTNRNVITSREVAVSVNKTNAMAYTAG